MRTPMDVPMFNSPRECVQWCVRVVRQQIVVSEPAKAWALAQLEAYRSGNWLGTNEKPKPKINASVSRFSHAITNSPADGKSQALRSASGTSRKAVSLVKLPEPKGEYDD